MKQEESGKFEYSYSAKEQNEIRKIMEKYQLSEEDKLSQLKRLDAEASKPGTIAASILGGAGTLMLGVGMSCTMVWSDNLFVLGIIIGLAGILCICLAYPIYKHITKKQREKIAPIIRELAEELTKK